MALAVILLVTGTGLYFLSDWFQAGRQKLDDELLLLDLASEPMTAEQLDDQYRLPDDATDTTSSFMEACRAVSTAGDRSEARGVPFADTSVDTSRSKFAHPNATWEQLTEARALLEKYEPTIRHLHKSTALNGATRFDTNFDAGFGSRLDTISDMQVLARLVQLDAYVAVHDKESARAFQSISTLLHMSKCLEGYPQVVAQLVRMSIARRACETIAELLPYLAATDDQLGKLMTELASHDFDMGLRGGLLGERVCGLIAFEYPETLMGETAIEVDKLRRWSRNGMTHDQAFYLKTMRELLEATEYPWPEKIKLARRALANCEDLIEHDNTLLKMQYVFSLNLLPALDAMFVATGDIIAERNIASTLIAVERYRLANATLPGALNELVPDFLVAIPIDPFTGQSLLYRVDEEYYVVYSVGEDQHDDGGQLGDYLEPDTVLAVYRLPASENNLRLMN